MSYNRKVAHDYDSKRRSNFAENRGTKPVFGQVGRKVDSESEKPKLPTVAYADRVKGTEMEHGEDSKSIRNELDDIEKDEEKDTDKTDFQSKPSPATTRKAPVVTHDDLVEKHSVGGAFSKAWTVVDHINVPPSLHPKKSWFFPNFIIGSVILEALETCLDGNEELKWIAPNYFSLPVRVYYCVMFYIQILKAKEAAGKIGKSEGSWFRAFKRNFPLESLPIVGPFVPFLSNITAVKPNDDKYDYIYPDYDVTFGLQVENGAPSVKASYFIQPNVLIVADFLRQFSTLTLTQLHNQTNNQYDYFNDEGSLIPHRIGQNFNFAGIEFQPALTVGTSSVLSNSILDKSLPETKSRVDEIHSFWRKSKATEIPNPLQTNGYTSLGESMRMIDDFEWFESCVQMAMIQCKFFSDSINMSQIPSTGGSEVLIGAHITGKNESYVAAEDWYPKHWTRLKSQFRTTRADTGPDQFFNAEYALTTGTISWQSNGHPIGGRQNQHRSGPYWNNREFEYELDTNVVVGRRMTTMIQSQFYDSRGNAS